MEPVGVVVSRRRHEPSLSFPPGHHPFCTQLHGGLHFLLSAGTEMSKPFRVVYFFGLTETR